MVSRPALPCALDIGRCRCPPALCAWPQRLLTYCISATLAICLLREPWIWAKYKQRREFTHIETQQPYSAAELGSERNEVAGGLQGRTQVGALTERELGQLFVTGRSCSHRHHAEHVVDPVGFRPWGSEQVEWKEAPPQHCQVPGVGLHSVLQGITRAEVALGSPCSCLPPWDTTRPPGNLASGPWILVLKLRSPWPSQGPAGERPAPAQSLGPTHSCHQVARSPGREHPRIAWTSDCRLRRAEKQPLSQTTWVLCTGR
ncbi:hypothetical protein MC885_013022 [Smutsia gigantea]|nr:hypothetical protein MC885_013022 [Smutsia gigantea]